MLEYLILDAVALRLQVVIPWPLLVLETLLQVYEALRFTIQILGRLVAFHRRGNLSASDLSAINLTPFEVKQFVLLLVQKGHETKQTTAIEQA